MNGKDQHEARKLAAKAWASRLPVTVLDRDSLPLATGRVKPDTEGDERRFWPDAPANADHLSANAAFVLYSDGRKVEVFDFHLCQNPYPPRHFDFRIRL